MHWPARESVIDNISPTMHPHREGEVFSRATTIPKPSNALKTGFFSLGYTGTKMLLQKNASCATPVGASSKSMAGKLQDPFKLARQNKEKNN